MACSSFSPDCHEAVPAAAHKHQPPGPQEAQEAGPHIVRVPGQGSPVLGLRPHLEPGLGEAREAPVAGGRGRAVHQDLPDLVSPAHNRPRALRPHNHNLGSRQNLEKISSIIHLLGRTVPTFANSTMQSVNVQVRDGNDKILTHIDCVQCQSQVLGPTRIVYNLRSRKDF